MKLIDISGMKFGRLTVIERSGKSKDGTAKFLCKCECGNVKSINSSSLRNYQTKSCGCLNTEATKKSNTKHGYGASKSRIPEYTSWKTMRQRCDNPNSQKYKDYGARGITVCPRWKDFKNFIDDMGTRPSLRHSIDRIDVNGNYEPNNCRWSLPDVQARNIRLKSKSLSGKNGVIWNKDCSKWRSSIRVDRKNKHIGYYADLQEAINARSEAENKYWGKSS